MQNQKKTLWLTALAGALTIAFASGCPDDDKSTSPSGSPSPSPSASGVDVKVHEWVKVGSPGANFAPVGKNVPHIAVSRDGKFLYAANAGHEVYGFDLADTSKFNDNSSWTKFDLNATGLAANDATVARARNLSNVAAATVNRLKGTETGVVGSTDAVAGAGAFLITGKTITAAWDSSLVNTFAADRAANSVWAGTLKNAADKEFIYVANAVNADAHSTINASIDAAGVVARLVNRYQRATNPFGTTKNFFVNAGGKALIVDARGIVEMQDAGIGAAATTGADSAGVQLENPNWRQVGGTANDGINDVVGFGDLVFVALNAGGADTGGVAVYNARTNAVKGVPNGSWSNKTVLTVVELDGKFYSVEADGLYLIDLDTANVSKRGAKFAANAAVPTAKAGVTAGATFDKDGTNLPASNITGAIVDKNGNLFIATGNDHIVVRKKSVAQKIN